MILNPSARIFIAVLATITIIVPALNLGLPETAALHVPNYFVGLFGKYLSFALLALSVDLIWGFCGILSLGHGAFFALGGYAMEMHLMRQIGERGVYGNPDLPDFMVFLDWKELPWYWYGFDHFAFAVAMAILVPAALAYLFGWLAFRSRITGAYFSIITQAMTFAFMLLFFRNDTGFGGPPVVDMGAFELQPPGLPPVFGHKRRGPQVPVPFAPPRVIR